MQTDAGKGVLKVQVAKAVTRKGEKRQEVGLKQEEQSKGVTRYYYNPQEAGKYEIEITFAGTQIKESPFFVTVIPGWRLRTRTTTLSFTNCANTFLLLVKPFSN